MGFVQHIKAIILPENIVGIKLRKKIENKNQGFAKNSCFVDSFVGVWALRPIFF
jgi:hypothetical protein